MKQPISCNLLAVAMASAACITAIPAGAIQRSQDGSGQAALLPFYTVEDGRSTVFAVSNHSDTEVKAVRVNLVEGANGRPALAFNLYLLPGDTWSGAIVNGDSDAAPLLLSGDKSCTSLADGFPATGVSLHTNDFSGARNDGLGQGTLRLRTGSIEVLEQGVLTGSVRADAIAGKCEKLASRFADGGAWATDPNFEITAPTGQLSAEEQLIDVMHGVAFSVPSIHFENFSALARHGKPNLDFDATRLVRPTLPANRTSFTVERDTFVPASRPADAVSLILMTHSLEAQFILNASLQARTEWVLTLPTRNAYLDNLPGGMLPPNSLAEPPFDQLGVDDTERCTFTTWESFSRDGIPSAAVSVPLCNQAQTVHLESGLGSPFDSAVITDFEEGRVRITMGEAALPFSFAEGGSTAAARSIGLPVVAYPLIEVVNTEAQPGQLASYAIVPHVVRHTKITTTP
jgi:hypothetical protein